MEQTSRACQAFRATDQFKGSCADDEGCGTSKGLSLEVDCTSASYRRTVPGNLSSAISRDILLHLVSKFPSSYQSVTYSVPLRITKASHLVVTNVDLVLQISALLEHKYRCAKLACMAATGTEELAEANSAQVGITRAPLSSYQLNSTQLTASHRPL